MILADEEDDTEPDEESESLLEKIKASFPLLMAWLYKRRRFSFEDMESDEVQKFVGEVTDYFNHAVDTSIRQVPMKEISVRRLKESNYVFSGIKVFHELNEAFPSMLDENNQLRPFEDFLNDVQKINNTYNGSYLRTEYNFARQSSLSAARWKQFEKDGDRYNLQYRTAEDERVRASHRKLDGITLPITSKFWDYYFPPNGWNCRCTVVQVRKGKYPESDEQKALDDGSQATAGKHQEMFKFNPGKAMTTFPAYNAYTIRKCKNCKYNGTMKLAADIPDNELCGACKIFHQCAGDITKSKTAIERKHYLKEMESLLEVKFSKKTDDKNINVGFSRNGNSHLYSDTFGRTKIVKRDDLKDLGKYLESSEYIEKSSLTHDRDDNIQEFYYFKTKIHNEWVRLNVAKEVVTKKNGRVRVRYYLYSVNDIKEESTDGGRSD